MDLEDDDDWWAKDPPPKELKSIEVPASTDDLDAVAPVLIVAPKAPEELCQSIVDQVPGANPDLVRALGPECGLGVWILLQETNQYRRYLRFLRELLKESPLSTPMLRTRLGLQEIPKIASELEERGIPVNSARLGIYASYSLDPSRYEGLFDSRRPMSSLEDQQFLALYQGRLRCVFCSIPLVINGNRHECLTRDHRVNFRVAGNSEHDRIGVLAFQPLCPSCNTQKDKYCKGCTNYRKRGGSEFCRTCFLADQDAWSHLGDRPRDSVDLGAFFEEFKRLR